MPRERRRQVCRAAPVAWRVHRNGLLVHAAKTEARHRDGVVILAGFSNGGSAAFHMKTPLCLLRYRGLVETNSGVFVFP